ncbi:hypothetical protein U9M48_027699 [Paspalum notatum var. saurae]|uniref:Uncharacterized protein n=1 Tax=Paspalum notatum var. saurae TaxID=547442 RepID=A0AAQ3TUX7_PASNO
MLCSQPSCFVDVTHPMFVASTNPYMVSSRPLTPGFLEAKSNTSLFMYKRDSGTAYLLLYDCLDGLICYIASSASHCFTGFLPNEESWSVTSFIRYCCYTLSVLDDAHSASMLSTS